MRVCGTIKAINNLSEIYSIFAAFCKFDVTYIADMTALPSNSLCLAWLYKIVAGKSDRYHITAAYLRIRLLCLSVYDAWHSCGMTVPGALRLMMLCCAAYCVFNFYACKTRLKWA